MILDLKNTVLADASIVLTKNDIIKNGILLRCTITLASSKVDLDEVLVNASYGSSCTVINGHTADLDLVKELATGEYSIQDIANILGLPFDTVQSILKNEAANFNTRRTKHKLQHTLEQDLAIANDTRPVSQACAVRHVSSGGYYKRLAQYKAHNMWPGEDNG